MVWVAVGKYLSTTRRRDRLPCELPQTVTLLTFRPRSRPRSTRSPVLRFPRTRRDGRFHAKIEGAGGNKEPASLSPMPTSPPRHVPSRRASLPRLFTGGALVAHEEGGHPRAEQVEHDDAEDQRPRRHQGIEPAQDDTEAKGGDTNPKVKISAPVFA